MMASPKTNFIDDPRMDKMHDFIRTAGWGDAAIVPLRADTSIRRYFRLLRENGTPRTAVLMDARPPENTALFEQMDKKFAALGFSVPDIYAANHADGFVLMEDFGDDSFFNLIQSGREDPEKLLTLAVDGLLHKYHANPQIALEGAVAYSDAYWGQRTNEFLDQYLPHTHQIITDDARAEYMRLFQDALSRAHRLPDILLHGDYGLQNFIYLPEREGIKALGLLDFQDTTDARGNMRGSPVFDLAFLLRDVRANYSDDLINRLKERFVQGAHISDRNVFEYEFATLVAAQSAKCLGLFARFGYGNNRTEYLEFIPYCWRHLHAAFTHPDLADLKHWFETHTNMGQR